MYKDYRYINAGTNEFYRWGREAQERIKRAMIVNKDGYCSIEANAGCFWTFGTSEGKFGEYAKYKDTYFSVNKGGYIWAKEGTEKFEKFIEMLKDMLDRIVERMGFRY